MSHESGDNKRLDPQLLPRPQSHPLNTAQQGQQLPRADKPHNSMRALPTDRALAQGQRSTFCESKAPRKEEKEGGLERPAWQPGEVTEVGQPAGLSTLVPPTFSNCPETLSFCNCPGRLEGGSKKKFVHTTRGICQGRGGWVSCIFRKMNQISPQRMAFPVLCFNISETRLPFEQPRPRWLEHWKLMATWRGGDPTSPVRAGKPCEWGTPALRPEMGERKQILVINATCLGVKSGKYLFSNKSETVADFLLLSLFCSLI